MLSEEDFIYKVFLQEKENECQEEIVKVKQIIKNLWDEAKRTRKVDNYV